MKTLKHGPRVFALTVLLAAPALAQRDAQVPDPDPEIERRSFQVAEGFEVSLYAADPLLAKPIQMNFDPAGRLWVATSEVYPQIEPGQNANDKVLVLEDRDGDGRAETTTVFADGLLIPTGVAPGDGGAYVANSTELVHLKDTDGDGKADARRVVLSGFGTEDTHHIIHTFRWGHDGALYFNQSTYIHSHIETPYGPRRLGGGGVWRFQPAEQRLEIFTRGLINPWGHQTDRFGQHFATDGAGMEGINYLVRGGSYAWTPGAPRIVAGLNPGSPKHCGLEILSGRHLPPDWQGNLITNDFRAHRVCRFVLTEDGSGYASRELPELIKTTHGAFRPIDVAMGPDGAIYVADWYNPIIQHGEVDFRDPRRDHTHGRIWRVVAKGRPLVDRPRFVDAPIETLLDGLKLPELAARRQARRALMERDRAEVLAALPKWLEGLDPKAADHDPLRLEALWTYQALDTPEPELLALLLGSSDGRVRAAAVAVAGGWVDRLRDPLAVLEPCVDDDHPRVRLEAVRALAAVHEPRAAALALHALDHSMDRFLDYALWLTLRELAPAWLPALRAGNAGFEDRPDHVLFALEAIGSPEVVPALLNLLKAPRLTPPQREKALALIANQGGPDELALVLQAAINDPAAGGELLTALANAALVRKVVPSGDLTPIGGLLDPKGPASVAAARAAGAWGLDAVRSRLVALATGTDSTPPARQAAIEALGRLNTAGSREALKQLAAPDAPQGARAPAVIALASIAPRDAAPLAVALLAAPPAAEVVPRVIEAFLRRREGPGALANALKAHTVPADVAKTAARLARGAGNDHPALVEALAAAGKLSARPEPPTGAERAALIADVARIGNPQRGEAIYRRADLLCLNCHAIAGAGGQVGPGLESIGASAPVDYLLDSLLEPNKAVKEGFHALTVATADGRVVTGIQLREADGKLVLRDADDREVTLPLADVEERKIIGSIMPIGQTDALTRPELLDLVRFLSELGKAGPYAVKPAPVVRRWRAIRLTPQQVGTLYGRMGYAAAARDEFPADWAPLYSTVAGFVPRGDLAAYALKGPGSRIALLRFDLDVTAEGPIALETNAPGEALEVWLDGKPQPIDRGAIVLSPTIGRHVVTLALDVAQLQDDLRCAMRDVAGSPAHVQIVVGK